MQSSHTAILAPLLVGLGTTVITIGIHALALNSIINFVRHERKVGRAGTAFLRDMPIVGTAVLIALTAHLTEIAAWGCVLEFCGEAAGFGEAFYRSALNYTAVGSSLVSPEWRLLEPLEAADGLLMFGVSTGMIFAVIERLVATRYSDITR